MSSRGLLVSFLVGVATVVVGQFAAAYLVNNNYTIRKYFS